MSTAPVEPGGIVRVRCDTTDGLRVDADVTAATVDELKCGCWRMRCDRPGPDVGPYTGRRMEVIFQRCGRFHDDGSQEDPPGTEHPAPIVVAASDTPTARRVGEFWTDGPSLPELDAYGGYAPGPAGSETEA